jgi:hypothetical protein
MKDVKTFMFGVVIGIPFGVFGIRVTFKGVKDNILYFGLEGEMWRYIFLLLFLIAIGGGLNYKGLSWSNIEALWKAVWIFIFPGVITAFIEIIRYERRQGPIYISKKSSKF